MAAAAVQAKDSVDVFGFGPRVRNALSRERILTVEDLLACDGTRLLDIRSFGMTMLDEVVDKLAEHGLELKPSTYLPPPRRVRPGDERVVREQVAKELRDYAGEPGDKWTPVIWETIRHCANLAQGES